MPKRWAGVTIDSCEVRFQPATKLETHLTHPADTEFAPAVAVRTHGAESAAKGNKPGKIAEELGISRSSVYRMLE